MTSPTRDIGVKVTTKYESKGLDQAADGLDRYQTEVAHTEQHVDRLNDAERDMARVSHDAAERVSQFKVVQHDATLQTSILEQEIRKAEQALKDLGTEFARTGNRTLFGDIRRQRLLLRDLNMVKDAMGEVTAEVKPFVASLSSGFTQAFAGLPEQGKAALIGGLVGIGAAAAPALGAVIAAAITGATGLGGIAGGILGASQDPRVKAAAKSFAADFMKMLKVAGTPFVEPVLRGMQLLESAVQHSHFAEAWAQLARDVEPVARGIAGFIEKLGPGLTTAFREASPAIRELAKDLPTVGTALAYMLTQAAEGRGTVEGMRFAFMLLDGTLILVGRTVNVLSDVFHGFVVTADNLLSWTQKIPGLKQVLDPLFRSFEQLSGHAQFGGDSLGYVGTKLSEVAVLAQHTTLRNTPLAATLGSVADQAHRVAKWLTDASDAMTTFVNTELSMTDGNIAFQEALDTLRQSIKDHNKSLDITTDKGRENVRTLEDMIRAAEQVREGYLQQGDFVDAQVGFERMILDARNAAIAMGLPRSKVEALIEAWTKVPAHKTTEYNVNINWDFILSRNVEAINELVHHMFGAQAGFGGHRAAGGPVHAGYTYLVGERGPELFTPRTPGYVNANGSGAMSTVRVVLDVSGGGDEIERWLKSRVRAEGGADVYFEQRR